MAKVEIKVIGLKRVRDLLESPKFQSNAKAIFEKAIKDILYPPRNKDES